MKRIHYCRTLVSLILFSAVVLISCSGPGSPNKEEKIADSLGQNALTVINESTLLAYEGGTAPLTTTPVVGTPEKKYSNTFIPGTEELGADEVRVTMLGSGDPFVKRSQASASILIEVGNEEHDIFFFDLGSGALANFTGLKLPVNSASKVFLTHLHADHAGDMPALVWSFAKSGRTVPVEIWGPAGATDALGTKAFATNLMLAYAWDTESLQHHPSKSGAQIIATEVPHDKTEIIYEKNGVTITSFPVNHIIDGAVGFRFDYNGISVVYSGDTRPCDTLQQVCKGGVDLLIHETFPTVATFAKKANVPMEHAAIVVNQSHTSPSMVGEVFKEAGARMSVMFHLAVDHETVGPAFREMREQYDGPVTISQDLTVFNITKNAIVVRQAIIDPVAWPVIQKTSDAAY